MLTSAQKPVTHKATKELSAAAGFSPTFPITLCCSVTRSTLTSGVQLPPRSWPQRGCGANDYSEQESRLVLERILNEWLVCKNFLQLSAVGQMENMITGLMIEITVLQLLNEMGFVKC